jgi:siroheme synthase-like protein
MLIDIVLEGEQALILGEGKEPEFKAMKLLDAKAKVVVIGESFTVGLRKAAARSRGRVSLVAARPTRHLVTRAVREGRPRVVFISTGRPELDEELSLAVRDASPGALVCVVDEPRLNDFNMPALAEIGDVRVGVSTGGMSPAMAAILRDKVERVVTRKDVLLVKLQGHMRRLSRRSLKGAASRKEFAYKVIRDRKIGALLTRGDYAGAKARAERMLEEAARRGQAGG